MSDVSLNLRETVAREQSETLLSDRRAKCTHRHIHSKHWSPGTNQKTARETGTEKGWESNLQSTSGGTVFFFPPLYRISSISWRMKWRTSGFILIPRLNSIQETQMNQTDDIASTLYSHAQLANYCLQMDYLQGQIFTLQDQLAHTDADMKIHFHKVEGSIDHLTTGMSLLYSMVKKINTTTASWKNFLWRRFRWWWRGWLRFLVLGQEAETRLRANRILMLQEQNL